MIFFNDNPTLHEENALVNRISITRKINNIILVLKYCGKKESGRRSIDLGSDICAKFNSATGHVNVTCNGDIVCDSRWQTFVPGDWYQSLMECFAEAKKPKYRD